MANRVEERKFPKAGSRESRAVTIEKSAIDGEKRTVTLAFSSEQPVVRWWGIEVLSHDPGAMDMSRMQNGGAVLLNHSTDKQIGVVEDCKCDPDKMGRATVRFSRSALGEEVFRDVAGRHPEERLGGLLHRRGPDAVEAGGDERGTEDPRAQGTGAGLPDQIAGLPTR